MGKHDKKPPSNVVEKSDMAQRETIIDGEFPEVGEEHDTYPGSTIRLLQMAVTQMDRNASASERIAVALERLADRYAPNKPQAGIPWIGNPNPAPPDDVA